MERRAPQRLAGASVTRVASADATGRRPRRSALPRSSTTDRSVAWVSSGQRLVDRSTQRTSSNSASWSSSAAADRRASGRSGPSCGSGSSRGRRSSGSTAAARSISTSSPVSSRVSRSAVSSMRLAGVGRALGQRPQRRVTRRWTRTTSRRPSTIRWTTPPADVARAVRRIGTAAPLGAAGARQPERERGSTGGQAGGAADRREPEAARLRAQRADGRDRRGGRGAAGGRPCAAGRARGARDAPDRRPAPKSIEGWETKRATRLTRMARHCTPARWPRKQKRERISPTQSSHVERLDLADAVSTSKRSASAVRALAPSARGSARVTDQLAESPPPGGSAASAAGSAATISPSTPSRTESPTPGPSTATAGRPAASASARTRPCVSVRDAKANRSAPRSVASASTRGSAPVKCTRPGEVGARIARCRRRSSGGPPPITSSRALRRRRRATASRHHLDALLRRQPAEGGDHDRVGRPAGDAGADRPAAERSDAGDVDAGRDHVRPGPARSAGEAVRISAARSRRRRHDRGAAGPEAAQVRIGQARARAGQRTEVVAVVGEAGVMGEDERRSRPRGPGGAPGGRSRTANGRGPRPARSAGASPAPRPTGWATACGSPAAPGAGSWYDGSQAYRGAGPGEPTACERRAVAGRGATTSTSWPRAPSPRARASTETVTPDR